MIILGVLAIFVLLLPSIISQTPWIIPVVWIIPISLLYIYYFLPKPLIRVIENIYPDLLTHVPPSTKPSEKSLIALTFDDVPYDAYCYKNTYLEIARLLEEYGMRGTFFVISDYVKNDEIKSKLVDLVRRGHQLANHGKTNTPHWAMDNINLLKEIDECQKLIKYIYNEANPELEIPKYYRPGSGLFNQRILNLSNSRKLTLTLGRVYPNDPFIPSAFINYWYCRSKIEAGDIVILHDRSWTVPMLLKLLPYLKQHNINSVTLQQLISSKISN